MQIGAVDVCNKLYKEFTDELRSVYEEIYEIVDDKGPYPSQSCSASRD